MQLRPATAAGGLTLPDLRLHHMGFVVSDIEKSTAAFGVSLNLHWDGRIFDDPHQRVRVAFLTTRPGDPQIELVQPAGGNSPVMQFLRERGGGLHHACYEVARPARPIGELPVARSADC